MKYFIMFVLTSFVLGKSITQQRGDTHGINNLCINSSICGMLDERDALSNPLLNISPVQYDIRCVADRQTILQPRQGQLGTIICIKP